MLVATEMKETTAIVGPEVCREEGDREAVEKRLGFGQVEELIEESLENLNLIYEMIEWEPWGVPEDYEYAVNTGQSLNQRLKPLAQSSQIMFVSRALLIWIFFHMFQIQRRAHELVIGAKTQSSQHLLLRYRQAAHRVELDIAVVAAGLFLDSPKVSVMESATANGLNGGEEKMACMER
ncbi:hypothetical protein OPV22_030160 [Ensete ventricosum]|uniref:Uncharacterized protein n=1 Tax=Ensete ventricosum TaxID=4639 RepID=A0AAV8QB92_ENSVE|nr:hypothetical protein OPV22_030160 [Ensete ventricosum]